MSRHSPFAELVRIFFWAVVLSACAWGSAAKHLSAQQEPEQPVQDVDTLEQRIARYQQDLQDYHAALASYESDAASYSAGIESHDEDVSHYASAVGTHNSNVGYHGNDQGNYESDLQRWSQDTTSYEQNLAEYSGEVTSHNQAIEDYEGAAADYESELDSYTNEVNWYNSLPEDQRTEFQYNRLNRWKSELDSRKAQLDEIHWNLDSSKSRLDNQFAYLDTKQRELSAFHQRLTATHEDLESRRGSLNQRKSELDDWATRLDRRKAELDEQQASFGGREQDLNQYRANLERRRTDLLNQSLSREERDAMTESRPQLAGFNVSFLGNGNGKLHDGLSFGEARYADGKMTIQYSVEGKDQSKTIDWRGEFVEETTSDANNLYRTQIWKFTSEQLGESTAMATLSGSETGASGTATVWLFPVSDEEHVKIKFAVQFTGENVTLSQVTKSFQRADEFGLMNVDRSDSLQSNSAQSAGEDLRNSAAQSRQRQSTPVGLIDEYRSGGTVRISVRNGSFARIDYLAPEMKIIGRAYSF